MWTFIVAWVIEGAKAMTSTTTSTATKSTRRHPGYGYMGIIAIGKEHCYLTTSKQRRSRLASTGPGSPGREEEVHQQIFVEKIGVLEESRQQFFQTRLRNYCETVQIGDESRLKCSETSTKDCCLEPSR